MTEITGGSRKGTSIFLKLLCIYLGTVLLVVALVLGFLDAIVSSGKSDKTTRDRNRAKYAHLLVEQLGSPPSLEKARALAEELSIQIRMEGPAGSWTTWEGLPALAHLDEADFRATAEPHTRFGTFKGSRFTLVEAGNDRFLIFFQSGPFRDARVELIPLMIGLVAAVLGLSYMLIRWLFRPLRWLMEGVREAGEGNLDRDVPIRGKDELGRLASSFNEMKRRIREMIRAKEQLLLDVSHELKSPITRIKLALELGKENSPAIVKRNVGEMESMISELLESARLESGRGALNLMPVNLRLLAQDAAAQFQDASPGVRVGPFPEDMPVTLDEKHIRTVLRNVLENAVKYSSHQERPVELGAEEEEGRVVVTVRDWGYGIPQADLGSIFEPFYRVDKSRTKDTGGYGLGLSLCRKIMEAHGGGIGIHSVEEKGTTVTIWFKS